MAQCLVSAWNFWHLRVKTAEIGAIARLVPNMP